MCDVVFSHTLRFARLQPAIKAVFHQLFGQQTSWDPAVLTKWKEIMVGSHDEAIRDFSEKTPEQFDTLATLLESRANTLVLQLGMICNSVFSTSYVIVLTS